jgi:hypothetical protein
MGAGELATPTFRHFRTRFDSKGYSLTLSSRPGTGGASCKIADRRCKPLVLLDNLHLHGEA